MNIKTHLRIIGMFLMLFIFYGAKAQNKGTIYIGVQPEITVEKEYAKGEFDVNIVPLVFQYWLSESITIRYSNILNVHVNKGLQTSQIGGQLAFPWYFLHEKESELSGFYIAPLGALTYNNISGGTENTLALEPGFTWFNKSGLTLSLGFQLGGTHFTANDQTNGWRSHGGLKFNIGYRFKPDR